MPGITVLWRSEIRPLTIQTFLSTLTIRASRPVLCNTDCILNPQERQDILKVGFLLLC